MSDLGTAYSPPTSGFGLGGSLDVGFPGVVNTALTIVLALVGLSMLIQVSLLMVS